jgi:ribosomal protein L6P/L9E
MKTLRLIQVTQDDIENGERADRENCMIARAVRRAIPNSFPRVDKGWLAAIQVCGKSYRQSQEIKERVISFDRGDKVLPFTICFDPKLKAATLGPDLFFIPLFTILHGKRPIIG